MTTSDNTSNSSEIEKLNEIESNVSMRTDEEIEILIKQTEEKLQTLMGELKNRQRQGRHQDIDNLEEHLHNADTSFKSLKAFIAMALREIKRTD